MRIRILAAAFVVAAAFAMAPIGVRAAPSQIVVFGDSLSDTGNLFTALGVPPSPYFNGRFSNGPNWVERLAGSFGLPVLPSLGGGTNYAFGGATTGPTGGTPPSLLDQFAGYNTAHSVADPNALYVVWGGGNDMRDALGLGTLTAISNAATTAVANLQTILTGLSTSGARHFLVPNLPDLSKIPSVSSLGSAAATFAASSASASFNGDLAAMLAGLAPTFAGRIATLDVFGILNSVIASPAAFGLTNVSAQCFSGSPTTLGVVCTNPDSYLFWDGIHPTAQGHAILANFAIQAVPEPATILIFVIGLLGLAMTARRTAARA